MPRSGEEARRRLQQAALELYREQGYEATTTADIAARAGVTERTFFRHFADKREVLFDGEDAFREMLFTAVTAAPAYLGPLGAIQHAFASAEALLVKNRAFTAPRMEVIARTPALQERLSMKTARLSLALAAALRARGIADGVATLAADAGMAAASHATRAWMGAPEKGYVAHLDAAFDELCALRR